ncbi:MAG: hypothetical protein KGL39_21085 [Patescibacteria group bacterium]|nr:hypothetical protein [Patescibacteria group bacterium]
MTEQKTEAKGQPTNGRLFELAGSEQEIKRRRRNKKVKRQQTRKVNELMLECLRGAPNPRHAMGIGYGYWVADILSARLYGRVEKTGCCLRGSLYRAHTILSDGNIGDLTINFGGCIGDPWEVCLTGTFATYDDKVRARQRWQGRYEEMVRNAREMRWGVERWRQAQFSASYRQRYERLREVNHRMAERYHAWKSGEVEPDSATAEEFKATARTNKKLAGDLFGMGSSRVLSSLDINEDERVEWYEKARKWEGSS